MNKLEQFHHLMGNRWYKVEAHIFITPVVDYYEDLVFIPKVAVELGMKYHLDLAKGWVLQ